MEKQKITVYVSTDPDGVKYATIGFTVPRCQDMLEKLEAPVQESDLFIMRVFPENYCKKYTWRTVVELVNGVSGSNLVSEIYFKTLDSLEGIEMEKLGVIDASMINALDIPTDEVIESLFLYEEIKVANLIWKEYGRE